MNPLTVIGSDIRLALFVAGLCTLCFIVGHIRGCRCGCISDRRRCP